MALKKVKGNLERMFDKNLTDLVRGIRNNRDNEAKYITQCMEEIKEELRQDNPSVKANAVAKLAYLQMLGYDISWAAFNVIEVMSSSKFTFKRIGYLAASQSFHDETEVLMLTTNMIRKDLNSVHMYESGVAMSGLACFVTPDLARDLSNDVMTLLTSTKPYLRKKAVLLMYKIFLRFPDALRPAFPKLKEKLEDPDPGVQSAAVNVICELARKNPKNYLPLAPVFFKLMTSSTNNWMLIKIIKLFGVLTHYEPRLGRKLSQPLICLIRSFWSKLNWLQFGALTPLEPRLGKKLIEPLTNLILSTSAMSLLYECINTVIAVLISISSGLPSHSASIQLCVQKLRVLIEDSDQNLKYLGLLAMAKILKTHPKTVQSHKDLVLQCLDDKDESIRLRALDLLYGMVSKKNLQEIVRKLMSHVDKAEGQHYRDQLLAKIIDICSQNNYQFIVNFEWYIGVLVELTRIEGTKHGELIAGQMLDVAIRVEAVRKEACRQMGHLLENIPLLIGQKDSITQVLLAAAYICGEFCYLLEEPEDCMEHMLKPRAAQLPAHIQATFVQNVLKIFASIAETSDDAAFRRLANHLIERLPIFVHSGDLEVQERACCALALVKQALKLFEKGEDIRADLKLIFQGELNPVAPKAQKKVPLPEGLDLDSWINEPPSDSESDPESVGGLDVFFKPERATIAEEVRYEPDEEELERRRKARKSQQADNPNYLKGSTKSKRDTRRLLERDMMLIIAKDEKGHRDKDSKKRNKLKKKEGRKRNKTALLAQEETEEREEEEELEMPTVKTQMELPDGAKMSDSDDEKDMNDPHRALDIDLAGTMDLLPSTFSLGNAGASKQPRVNARNHVEKATEAGLEGTSEAAKENRKFHRSKKDKTDRKDRKDKKEAKGKKKDKLADLLEGGDSAAVKPKSKKSKHDKESKGEPSDRKRTQDDSKKLGYEEAPGIATPSHERGTSVPQTPMSPSLALLQCESKFEPLKRDSNVDLSYEIRTLYNVSDQLVCALKFTNKSARPLKQLELSFCDGQCLRFVRPESEATTVAALPFALLPSGASHINEFSFDVKKMAADTVKATLTYMRMDEDGAVSKKLDCKIKVPLVAFLVPRPVAGDMFDQMLTSGSMNAEGSLTIPDVEVDFTHLLSKLAFHARFALVEQVGQSASLLATAISGELVCLLVKRKDHKNHLVIDGKSSSEQLLTQALAEINRLITSGSLF